MTITASHFQYFLSVSDEEFIRYLKGYWQLTESEQVAIDAIIALAED